MKRNEIQEINQYLLNKRIISVNEFKEYFFNRYPEKQERFFNYYLSDLYRNNVLYRYDIGILKTTDGKKDFIFSKAIEDDLMEKLECINPSIDICIWQLLDLTNFMSLQSFKNIKFIETYSYATEVILNLLINCNKKVVIENDYFTYVKYNNYDELYIIRSINEDSPIVKHTILPIHQNYITKSYVVPPKLEKIIVDIIIDDFFNIILGDEIFGILCELLKKYKINIATIKRYATKKNRWAIVKSALVSTGFNIDKGEF